MQEETVARKEDEEIEPLLLHRRRNATGPKQNLVFHRKIFPPAALPTARHVTKPANGKW